MNRLHQVESKTWAGYATEHLSVLWWYLCKARRLPQRILVHLAILLEESLRYFVSDRIRLPFVVVRGVNRVAILGTLLAAMCQRLIIYASTNIWFYLQYILLKYDHQTRRHNFPTKIFRAVKLLLDNGRLTSHCVLDCTVASTYSDTSNEMKAELP